MTLSAETVNLYFRYLKADGNLEELRKEIKDQLKKDYKSLSHFQNDFYTAPFTGDTNVVLEWLLYLNIDPDTWALYLNRPLPLHAFLSELNKNEKGTQVQIHWLLDLIENKRRIHLAKIAMYWVAALVIILIPLCVYFNAEVLNILEFLIEEANLSGIAVALATLTTSIYLTHTDTRTPVTKIRAEYAFILPAHALNISGKVLLAFSQALLTSIAQGLFIAAALINFLKQVYHYRALCKKAKEMKLGNNTPFIKAQQFIRIIHERKKQRDELIISGLAAVSVLALVLCSVAAPPGFIVTLGISLSICAIYLFEQLALWINAEKRGKLVHDDLKSLFDIEAAKLNKSPVNLNPLNKLSHSESPEFKKDELVITGADVPYETGSTCTGDESEETDSMLLEIARFEEAFKRKQVEHPELKSDKNALERERRFDFFQKISRQKTQLDLNNRPMDRTQTRAVLPFPEERRTGANSNGPPELHGMGIRI